MAANELLIELLYNKFEESGKLDPATAVQVLKIARVLEVFGKTEEEVMEMIGEEPTVSKELFSYVVMECMKAEMESKGTQTYQDGRMVKVGGVEDLAALAPIKGGTEGAALASRMLMVDGFFESAFAKFSGADDTDTAEDDEREFNATSTLTDLSTDIDLN